MPHNRYNIKSLLWTRLSRLSPAVIAFVGDRSPHDSGRQTVVPLLRQGAKLAVEFPHGDALRVQHLVLDHLFILLKKI